MTYEPAVFLVDDDASVRDAVGLLLEALGLAVKTYSSAQAFLDSYESDWSGCMVLDITMPGMSGLRLQEELINRQIEIPIIFLTGHGDVRQSAKAFKAGAIDFLEKPFKDEELLERIREAIEIDTYNRDQKARVLAIKSRFLRLTPREQQVMLHVISGKSNKEIARELEISHRTIDIHRARIMEKMNAKSLAELITMAASSGLVQS